MTEQRCKFYKLSSERFGAMVFVPTCEERGAIGNYCTDGKFNDCLTYADAQLQTKPIRARDPAKMHLL